MTPVLEERKCMTKVQKDLWSSILSHIDRTVWLYFSASLLPFQNLNFGFCLSTLLWCGEKEWFIYSSDLFHWLTRFICTKTIHDIQLIMQTRVFYCLRHRIGEREWAPGIEKLYWTQMNMIIFLFCTHLICIMQDCMRVDEFLGERIFQSWRSKEYQPKITISWQIF